MDDRFTGVMGRMKESNGSYRPGIHAVALFAAAFTLPLLYVGGSVTTYRVGMAVPDWPTTFQENMFRYDFWNAPFGVRVEHTHRLYGAAVGMASILLMASLLAFDPRRWMKGLGVLALAAVIVQGEHGGLRVTKVSTVLAAVHGCTGQAYFGLLVALCVFTGRDWNNELTSGPPIPIACKRLGRSAMAAGAWRLVYAPDPGRARVGCGISRRRGRSGSIRGSRRRSWSMRRGWDGGSTRDGPRCPGWWDRRLSWRPR